MDFISQFTTNIQLINGMEKPVANALSHVKVNTSTTQLSVIDFTGIAAAQKKGLKIKYFQTPDFSLSLRESPVPTYLRGHHTL